METPLSWRGGGAGAPQALSCKDEAVLELGGVGGSRVHC